MTSADRASLMAFVADEASEAAIRGGIGDVLGAQLRRGTVRTAVKALEKEGTPRVLIVDISGIDDPFGALDDLASVCTPDVRVLVVGERTEIGFYRDITRNVGVHEYLPKPLTRDTSPACSPPCPGRAARRHGSRRPGARWSAACTAASARRRSRSTSPCSSRTSRAAMSRCSTCICAAARRR